MQRCLVQCDTSWAVTRKEDDRDRTESRTPSASGDAGHHRTRSLLVEICRETAARLGYDVQAIWDLLVGGFGYDAWAVGTWTESTGRLHDLRNVEQQNVLFYDRRVVTIPVMPSDLKSLLRWVRG